MKTTKSKISELSNLMKKKTKIFEPVSIMKKLRSKIPRRKRFQISPILRESVLPVMKKLRSKIPRRKRIQISPIVRESVLPITKKLRSKIPRQKRLQISAILAQSVPIVKKLRSKILRKKRFQISPILREKKIPDEISCTSNLISVSGRNSEGNNVCEAISETCCIQSVYSSKRKNSKSENEEIISAKKKSKVVEIQGDEIRVSESTVINQTTIQISSDSESDCKLSCSQESDYSKSKRISELDSEFQDFMRSSFFDSESQTEEGFSPGPTAYLSFLTQYSNEFSRLSSVVVSSAAHNKVSSQDYTDIHTYSRFEDETDEESYNAFRTREINHVIPYNYLEDYYSTSCGHLISQQRQSIVNWIINESDVRQLNLETVFLSVSLLDRFLNEGFFKNKRKLQLLGIACLTLARKIEENQTYDWQKTFQIGSDVYTRCEVVAMEWLVQKVLNFKCIVPTTFNFLWFYLKVARASEEMEDRAKYLTVLSLMDPDLLCYWPSTVAAGLVILSALTSDQDSSCQYIMETHIRTNNDDLSECIESLEWLVEYVS